MEAFPPRATRSAPDLVVVGASFAGAACAIAAAQRGLHVVVLERKRDPGAKLRTTGTIVKETAEATLLGQLPAALVRRVEQVRLYAPLAGRADARERGRPAPGPGVHRLHAGG